jgi:hypothetical protein
LRDSSHSYKREQFISCYSIYLSRMDNSRAKFSTHRHMSITFLFVKSHTFFSYYYYYYVLKIEDFSFFAKIIKDFIYSYATTSSSCILTASFFILLLFFHFFSHLILFSEQLKQQFMTIIIHYMNIFLLHLLLFPLRVYTLYALIHACHVFYLTSRALICRLWQISYHHQLQH